MGVSEGKREREREREKERGEREGERMHSNDMLNLLSKTKLVQQSLYNPISFQSIERHLRRSGWGRRSGGCWRDPAPPGWSGRGMQWDQFVQSCNVTVWASEGWAVHGGWRLHGARSEDYFLPSREPGKQHLVRNNPTKYVFFQNISMVKCEITFFFKYKRLWY